MADMSREPGPVALIVDDEESLRSFASTVLKLHGFRVREASSLAQGSEAARDGCPIDLFLVDARLPDGCGASLAPAVRERHPSAQLWMMSGVPYQVAAGEGHVPSGARFLEKPFTLAGLAAVAKSAGK
jgi:DNA-binding NtrC family response regulator